MSEDLPRITAVSAETDTALRVAWKGGGEDVIELAGWLARVGLILAPLRDPSVFRVPVLAHYGAAVGWGDEDGDLAIDAYHLSLIAAEQRPFDAPDLAAWQAQVGLSTDGVEKPRSSSRRTDGVESPPGRTTGGYPCRRSSCWISLLPGASGLHDIYGSALAAQPGKS